MESRERYDELCRLCASYDAVKMDIFGQEGKNRQLVDKIQTCLPFKIAEDDRLPKCLCYRCMYNLENFYDFRTACVNAVALLERKLPLKESSNDGLHNDMENHSELRSELLKEKEKMPILIPEAPIVNPNAALGTPPRLNSDGEADQEIEEILEHSGTEEGLEDGEDRKYDDEYEMDMETNPSDFLEMPPMVTEDTEENDGSQLNSVRSPALFQHKSEHHEVYVCSLCNKAFSSKGHLSLHARIHAGAGDVVGEKVITDDHTSFKRLYQCDLCNKSYSTAKHRWGHVSSNHRGHPAVTCQYCARLYSTRGNLMDHIKSRHTGQPPPPKLGVYVPTDNRFQCNTCPKMYTNITDLNKHKKVCTGTRESLSQQLKKRGKSLMDTSEASSFESDEDSKDYRTAEAKLSKNPQLTILKQALTRGVEVLKRDDRDPYKSLRVPQIDHADAEGKRWFCETCPQSFTSIEALKDHEVVHESDKPFICLLCKKHFTLKSSLSRHIIATHGVDPGPMIDDDKCYKRKSFSSSTVLSIINDKQQHHSTRGDLKIKREPSELSFSPEPRTNADDEEDPDNNQQHDMIEIETVFVCEICTRDFNDRASLWLHIRATHKEYAAFACGVCLKICTDNDQLLNHVNMYHGASKLQISEQRRYSCTICGRQHDSRKKLMTHVSIHNIDPSYDPANFVQLNSGYYSNENININNDGHNNQDFSTSAIDFDHEDGEKVDCFICYKSFPNEDHLIRHQRNAHKSDHMTTHAADHHLVAANTNGPANPNGNKAQYHLFFVCEICGSSHPSKWERWLHVSSVHSTETQIRCEREDCAKIFATKSLKNEHNQHHVLQGASPNTCEICGKLWGSRVDYWKHVMGVHSDTVPLICGVCLKVFPDVVQLSAHVKSKHWPLTNGDFSCDICGRPYSNKSKMSRHRKIHGLELESYSNGINDTINDSAGAGPGPNASAGAVSTAAVNNYETNATTEVDLTCEMCTDLLFPSWEDLCHHRRMIHGLFPCDLCNKCYGRTSHLWKHVNRVHKGHKDVTCKYCLKTSASKDHLTAHIAKIHRYEPETKQILKDANYKTQSVEEDTIHHCEKCNKAFHKRYLLKRHMKGCQNYRKDPGALLTRCRACERIFKDRASLQKHIENHHSSYTCHLCNETITSKLGIMTHNRVNHMNHPDLTCDHANCKKLFRTKEDLEVHRKDHKYHSPNVCDFCGDTVENKLKLKMHILSLHRNEIGVSCGVCLIPMKDPQELKNHVESVHPGVLLKPNTCQVCGKQYASKWKAFDHTKKCHGKVFRTCKQCLAVFTTDADIRYHYEHIHNVPKDQLAGFENNLDAGGKGAGNDDGIKEEPDDLEYDDGVYDDIPRVKSSKRKPHDTYDCEICPEIFLNYDTLADHYQLIHNTDPERMFKKMKTNSGGKRRMRNRENFECENCKKQFCTKTLFWNHISNCTRKNNYMSRNNNDNNTTSTSILETHLKNNNLIKKEPNDVLNESNLNIPDFNLFEDINLQLSGHKPVPNLMPLSSSHRMSPMKCNRKDSRKVYDESTNTVCACEVCGKQWPAKKHLWQHLIRFHRAEAAVTCGVCLKLCTTYRGLSQHLKEAHEAILSCEGNNFTCKTCGRYHNARSKLLLHMSIHINNNEHIWCSKCAVSFETQEKLKAHMVNCAVNKQRRDEDEDNDNDNDNDHDNDNDDEHDNDNDHDQDDEHEENSVDEEDVKMDTEDKGSLIGDGASLLGEDDDDDEGEGEGEEEAEAEEEEEDAEEEEEIEVEGEGEEGEEGGFDSEGLVNGEHTEESACESDSEEHDHDNDNENETIDKEDNSDSEEHDESDVEKDEEDKESKEPEDVRDNDTDDDGPPVLSPMMPIHEDDDKVEELKTKEDIPELDGIDKELLEGNSGYYDEFKDESEADDDRLLIEQNTSDSIIAETDAEAGEDADGYEEQEMQINDLDGTVLMVTNDADGNQILVQQNVEEINEDDDGESIQDVADFIYQVDNDNYDGDAQMEIQEVQDEEDDGEEHEDIDEANSSAKKRVSRT
ncbi:zinc finger protein 208 [Microplitis demolitor]|uniref:zinc finger protein 208 n=1 Tax=Microplitis demolitor TaxID=69319 RepID=UPI0004CD1CD7|nr:zinc finger protein 208 [Microplitis demolitor]